MRLDIRFKLSVMMFLQYFMWGAWFVTLGTYLGAGLKIPGDVIGWCYAALPLAAMVSPFFVGIVADRFFATERILAALHLLGAGLLFVASQLHGQLTGDALSLAMFWTLFVYALCYMPTLALTNTLSFHQMQDPSKEFPGIRVWGTIGWIAAGTLIGLLRLSDAGGWSLAFGGGGAAEAASNLSSIEATHYPMLFGAVISAALGLYCLFLPHTPPRGTGSISVSDILGLKALALMREPSFAVFVIGSFLICIPLQFYYAFTNQFLNAVKFPDPAFSMTFGQWSEIFFMLVMPIFFVRLGVKRMLLFGMLAWTVRYFLFSFGEGALLDHGVKWMLYAGIILHGICYDFFFVTGQIYVDQKSPPEMRGAAQGFIAFVTLGAGGAVGSVLSGRVLKLFETGAGSLTYDWSKFWMVPAIGAAVVMVLFALLFHEKPSTLAARPADVA
jgi:nucleoside transporter